MTTASTGVRRNALKSSAVALAGLLAVAGPGASHAQTQQSPASGVTAPTAPADIEAAKPNPQAPGFRIPLPPLDQMDPAERADFETQSKAFYTPVGPHAPLIITPELSKAWAVNARALQKSTIPQDSYELTIIMVGAEWRAGFEWWVHAPLAVKAGVPADAVEAIRLGKTPNLPNARQKATYDFLHELLGDHRVSDATYARLLGILGAKGLVELTTLAGHYTNLSMMIVAHGVPLRAGVPNPFPDRK